MKLVPWTDENGYDHLTLIRDNDPEEFVEHGIPCDPPDLSRINWDDVQRDLHNMLISKRLITWEDVQASQNGVSSSIIAIIKKRIIMLYRTGEF